MKRILVVFVLLLLFSQAYAQEDFNWQLFETPVMDARAQAMGHCEIFGPMDATAIFTNPAYMGTSHYLSVEVGGATRFGSVEDEDVNDMLNGTYEANYTGKFNPEFAAVALPIRLKGFPISFGAGVGIWTMHELGWNEETTYMDGLDEYTFTSEYTNPMKVAGVGLSAGLFDMLYAGITTASSTGEEAEILQTWEERTASGTMTYETTVHATPSFSVAVASLVIKPNDKFKLGVMARPSYDIEVTDIETVEEGITYPESDVTLTVPSVAGISVALSPDKLVEFMIEYQSRALSEAAYTEEGMETTEFDIDNGKAFRAGAEFGVFHVGYFSEDILAQKWDDTAPQSREGWTFGLGYWGERISLHVAGEYAELSYEAAALEGSGTRDVKITNWRIGVGLGVHLF